MEVTLIEKEQIGEHKVIAAPENKAKELYAKLLDAQRLGNEFKSKVSLTFNTEDGPMRVETTVWSLTEKYVQIKSGVLIPLTAMIAVDF